MLPLLLLLILFPLESKKVVGKKFSTESGLSIVHFGSAGAVAVVDAVVDAVVVVVDVVVDVVFGGKGGSETGGNSNLCANSNDFNNKKSLSSGGVALIIV
jgi:hypothetical protein